jgi:anti-sigma factor RsiW
MSDSTRTQHIDDDAELYALGVLDAHERAAVEAHIAGCTQCMQRVRDAEETAFALSAPIGSAPTPPALDARIEKAFSPRMPARAWMAIAAAFLIGLLPSVSLFFQSAQRADVQRTHDAATVAMVNSHFAHAQFSPVNGAALPPAKVIFARDGKWLYIVVSGDHQYDVEGLTPSGSHLLGTTVATSSSSELFVTQPPKVSAVLLLDNGVPVGRARVISSVSR